MLMPTIIMGVIAAVLLAVGYSRGGGEHIGGLRASLDMTLQILPLLVFAFIVAGMMQVLIPTELISKWVGAESGLKGILLGSVAGALTPGGPFVSMPIVAVLIRAGASVGTTVAFLTGWSIVSVARIPMEVGLLGWKFTAIRLTVTFFFPPLAGIIAQRLFSGARLF